MVGTTIPMYYTNERIMIHMKMMCRKETSISEGRDKSHRAHDGFGKIDFFVIRKQQPLLAWTANKVIPLLRFVLSTLDGTTLILFCCNRRLHVSSKDDNCGIDLHGCEFSTLR